MARRTKVEAQQTYNAIIKAALLLFSKNGVHNTTLEQIAVSANMTRGAIYWHFSNKNEILYAIGEYVTLMIKEKLFYELTIAQVKEPLEQLKIYLEKIIFEILNNEEIYQSFAILNCKCEYIESYKAILDKMIFCNNEHIELFTAVYDNARKKKLIREDFSTKELAIDTYSFLTGMIRLILISGYTENTNFKSLITTHINLRYK